MADDTQPRQEQSHFRVVLRPHRSLSPRGLAILMGLVGGVSFLAGLYFSRIGAWPVTGFFGLDALLIYGAFRLNNRAARLTETIEIVDAELQLTRRYPNGREERATLNPYWAHVHLAEREDGANRLLIRSHGHSYALAAFLTDEERRTLAVTLADALARARA